MKDKKFMKHMINGNRTIELVNKLQQSNKL